MQRRRFLQLGATAFGATLLPQSFLAATDKNRLRVRGLTVDAARLPEKPEYYRRVIDFCHDWGLNTLLFRLTDDQGSAFRFASHAELVTHEHALTPVDARALAEYGRKRAVMVIPEIESFGHTTYITSVSQWAHLADTPAGGRSSFFGLSPVHPDSLRLMRDLYAEAARAFESPWLHGGCDEANWGGSELSQRALKKASRSEIWADYLNALDGICRELGRELIVWGDFVAHKEPDILKHLNRRVIVMDWQYYVTDPQPLRETAAKITNSGLRVIGAPALISCEWGPRAGEPTLRNIDAFADAYRAIEDEHCLGVIVTNWMPSRYLQGSLWDSFAYAAVALNEGGAAARDFTFRRFVQRFYGAKWNADWQEVFDNLYRLTPGRTCARDWKVPRLPLPPSNDGELKRSLDVPPLDPRVYEQLVARVRALEKNVRRNREAFQSFALAVDYLEHLAWQQAQWQRMEASPSQEVLSEVARRGREMAARLDAEWDVGRFEDDRAKREKVFGLTAYDQLLLQMRLASEYAESAIKKQTALR